MDVSNRMLYFQLKEKVMQSLTFSETTINENGVEIYYNYFVELLNLL